VFSSRSTDHRAISCEGEAYDVWQLCAWPLLQLGQICYERERERTTLRVRSGCRKSTWVYCHSYNAGGTELSRLKAGCIVRIESWCRGDTTWFRGENIESWWYDAVTWCYDNRWLRRQWRCIVWSRQQSDESVTVWRSDGMSSHYVDELTVVSVYDYRGGPCPWGVTVRPPYWSCDPCRSVAVGRVKAVHCPVFESFGTPTDCPRPERHFESRIELHYFIFNYFFL